MAQDKKKKVSGTTNPDNRPNGKAWKKPKAPKRPRTPEAETRYYEVLTARQRRKEANLDRREAEKAAAAEKKLQEAIVKAIEFDKVYVGERLKQIAAA